MIARLLVLTLLIGAFSARTTPAFADHIPPNGYFTDDDGNIHERNIDALRASGITKGCNPPTNDRFCPDDRITRAEMATFLVRALDLPAATTDYFVDDSSSVHENSINALREAGLTFGCRSSGDRYCPTEPVTRGQMAAFLVRSFRFAPADLDYFTDDNGNVFEASINAIAQAKVTVGCGTDIFCPQRDVTRAEMATFLTRAIPLTRPTLHDQLVFSLPFSGVCDPLQLTCQKTISSPRLDEYFIDEGWFYHGPFASGDAARFAAATFELTMNDIPVPLTISPDATSGGTVRRSYTATLGKLAPGTYVFRARWIWDGQVKYTTVLTLNVAG